MALKTSIRRISKIAAVFALFLAWRQFGDPALGQVAKQGVSDVDRLTLEFPVRTPATAGEPLQAGDTRIAPAVDSAWNSFQQSAVGEWKAFVDPRSGRIGYVEGSGLPWIPGFGNRLGAEEVAAPLGAGGAITLKTLEALARTFLRTHGVLLGVDPAELRLAAGRSGNPAPHLWLVEFDLVRDGLTVEGARVVFRINNGNLIQFGTENLPAPGVAVPRLGLGLERAAAIVHDYVGNLDTAWDEWIDDGSQHLMAVAPPAERAGGDLAFGAGMELLRNTSPNTVLQSS